MTAPAVRPYIVGIAGGSGSGKSTVARLVAQSLSPATVAGLDMDAYYRDHSHLTFEERQRINWDHPDAFDTGLLAEHVAALQAGRGIDKPVYDFVRHARAPVTERVEPADVIVIEGILLLADARVRDRCHVRIFVDADADIRLIRRIRRDMAGRGRPLDEILEQYLTTVKPMHEQFVEPSKRWADIIVPRGGQNAIAVEMIVAKIQRRLRAAAS